MIGRGGATGGRVGALDDIAEAHDVLVADLAEHVDLPHDLPHPGAGAAVGGVARLVELTVRVRMKVKGRG